MLVAVEAELSAEELVLPVRLNLLDGFIGGVLVDNFEHRDLVVPAPVSGSGLQRHVAPVPAIRVADPASEEAVGSFGRTDVLMP